MADLGYVKPSSGGKSLSGLADIISETRNKKKEEAGNIAMKEAIMSGDPAKLTQMMEQYPEHSERAKEWMGIQDTMKKDTLVSMWEGSTEALNKPDLDSKIKFLQERKKRLESQGRNTRHTDEALEIATSGAKDAEQQLDTSLQNAVTLAERRGAVDPIGGSAGKFSSKQTTYKDGSILQGDPAGGSRFYNAAGIELPVGSPEREAAIANAIKSGVQYEYDKSYQGTLGSQTARGETEADIQKGISIAKWEGANEAEEKNVISTMRANLPSLVNATNRLKTLAASASFSLPQRAWDATMNQVFGFSTKGGNARARLESLADNMVLPLLKQTFGAAFTAAEGERLRAALIASNATPAQKAAQLEEFINAKVLDLQSKEAKYANTDAGQVAFPEGMEIENDQGDVLVRQGGQWIPKEGGQ